MLPATPETLEEALKVLKEGGTVAHATETCYGLACDVSNPKAVAHLFHIKQRSEDQPVSVLFSSLEQAKEHVSWNDEVTTFADENLPGPLTIVLPIREEKLGSVFPTPKRSTNNEQRATLGIRLSPHHIAHELVERFGGPLSTTSANVSGKPPTYSAQEIEEQFKDEKHQPDLIIDSGVLERNPPSKVIAFEDGRLVTLR